MPRTARIVVPGAPHHVTQRGNRAADIFSSDDDRRKYLELVGKYAGIHGVKVHAYCLMPNHVHLIVTPTKAESLGAMLKPVHLRYAQHVNWTQDLSGRLWQGRYYSCAMDDAHTWNAVRYVEDNPVRAGLAKQAEDYPWSSAAAHCGLRSDPLLTALDELTETGLEWRNRLREPEDEVAVLALRMNTRTGRPLGSDGFLSVVEKLLKRRVRPLPRGRPPKER